MIRVPGCGLTEVALALRLLQPEIHAPASQPIDTQPAVEHKRRSKVSALGTTPLLEDVMCLLDRPFGWREMRIAQERLGHRNSSTGRYRETLRQG
jgi:hypothetical protein